MIVAADRAEDYRTDGALDMPFGRTFSSRPPPAAPQDPPTPQEITGVDLSRPNPD